MQLDDLFETLIGDSVTMAGNHRWANRVREGCLVMSGGESLRMRRAASMSWRVSAVAADSGTAWPNAGACARHERLYFGEAGHRRVAGGSHGQRPVGGAVLHGRLQVAGCQQAIDEAGGEAVTAAYPVVDLQRPAVPGL
jgi:hypothetical protein